MAAAIRDRFLPTNFYCATVSVEDRRGCCKTLFLGISTEEFACKVLNFGPAESRKFQEITALVPLSTTTGVCAQNPPRVFWPCPGLNEAIYRYLVVGRLLTGRTLSLFSQCGTLYGCGCVDLFRSVFELRSYGNARPT